MYIHTYIEKVYTCIYITHMYIYIHITHKNKHIFMANNKVACCLYIYIYIYIYIWRLKTYNCIKKKVFTCTYIQYIQTYKRTYIHMHICNTSIYTYIYVYTDGQQQISMLPMEIKNEAKTLTKI
jgi:hypothetical protein